MARHRYAHSVRPVNDDRQPARFIALELTTKVIQNEQEKRKRSRTLASWSVQTWSCEAGRAGKASGKSGHSLSKLWGKIAAPLSLPGLTWLVCHGAVGVSAMLGIFDRLTDGSLVWADGGRGMCCLEDPPTILDLHIPGRAGILRIVDVRNWGMTDCRTVAEIGNAVRAMVSTLAERGLGSLQVTAGSQAWFSYRRKYVRHNLYVHCRAAVLAHERRALAGGRCECYRLGKVNGPVRQLDFTSFYGSILRDCSLPVRLRYYGDGSSQIWEEERSARVGAIAACSVSTAWPHLPHSRDGIVIYPTGRFWTTLCGPDLYAALDAGEIVGFGRWATYDLEGSFRHFGEALWQIRRAADRSANQPISDWAKALAVTLVGRFAQRGRHWEETGKSDPTRPWGHWTCTDLAGRHTQLRSLAGRVQRQVDHGETRESMPALAAYVYAYGRRKLWEAQLAAGRDEVYYCVTDSLFVSQLGYERLLSYGMVADGEAGKLRLVATHEWMEIFGLNHYRVPGKYVCAGALPHGSDVGRAGVIGWRQRTAREAIALGRAPTAEEILCSVERISPYRHGVREADGRVTPWRIGDGGN